MAMRRRFWGLSIKVVFFFPLNSTNRGLGVAAGFLRDNYYREQK
jgi:hypothetical protein